MKLLPPHLEQSDPKHNEKDSSVLHTVGLAGSNATLWLR
jgi:hypothetical protein